MKQTLFLMFLVIISLKINAQDFAPVGAEWHWDERFAFSGDINFIKFQSEKDTLVNDELCKKIIKRHKLICNDRPDVEYLFTRNDTVFFLDTIFNSFQILYDFNAEASDSWIILIKDETNDIDSLIITVDSTAIQQINDLSLKVLYVTYFKNDEFMPEIYSSQIIERIGDVQYMFNWNPFSTVACDGNYSNGLRCYQDNELGLYSTGITDSCNYTYTWLNVDQNNMENSFSIYPNPAHDNIKVEATNNSNNEIVITDIVGKVIFQKQFYGEINIDISDFIIGVYLASIFENKQKIGSRKFVKN